MLIKKKSILFLIELFVWSRLIIKLKVKTSKFYWFQLFLTGKQNIQKRINYSINGTRNIPRKYLLVIPSQLSIKNTNIFF